MIDTSNINDGKMTIHVECDQCGIRDWHGYLYTFTISTDEDDYEHEFCSLACVTAWIVAHKESEEAEEALI